MPTKILRTRDFGEYEPGATVTYWVNPPTGYVRQLQKALARLNIKEFAKGAVEVDPKDTAGIMRVLDAAEQAINADDAVWKCVLSMVDSWTLHGWADAVLPVTTEGLDELDEAPRLAVLSELQEALAEVRRPDPKRVASSSPGESEQSDAGESDTASITNLNARSPYHPPLSETA